MADHSVSAPLGETLANKFTIVSNNFNNHSGAEQLKYLCSEYDAEELDWNKSRALSHLVRIRSRSRSCDCHLSIES